MDTSLQIIRQAGAIVYRFDGTTPNVLLVRSKKHPAHWIFPKGHLEEGETEEAAGVRELLEEAGVSGLPVRRIGEREFQLDDKRYIVGYFLLRYRSTEHAGEQGRDPRWCTPESALSLLSFPDARELLEKAIPFLKL